MAGKFERKLFSQLNLDDPFFDSLKADYPGSAKSTGFINWFHKKAVEGKRALVFEDEQGIGAFINLKPGEDEEIRLSNGSTLPKLKRLKITTIKIDERYQHQRIGEGAIGLTLWYWRDLNDKEIYVTVFEKHTTLIYLLIKFGFKCMGINLNGEKVFTKNRDSLDFSDPFKAFPFINGSFDHAGCLAIEDTYHDTMFAYSELANTLQEHIDMKVANGLMKVYLGSPFNISFKPGDPILIYRKYTGSTGKPGYKSCITSFCVVTRIIQVKSAGRSLISYEEYRKIIENKSVFDDNKLQIKYNSLANLTLIEMLYLGYFGAGNNVNWVWLKNHDCWPGTHPINFRYSKDKFCKILQEGKVNVENVIID